MDVSKNEITSNEGYGTARHRRNRSQSTTHKAVLTYKPQNKRKVTKTAACIRSRICSKQRSVHVIVRIGVMPAEETAQSGDNGEGHGTAQKTQTWDFGVPTLSATRPAVMQGQKQVLTHMLMSSKQPNRLWFQDLGAPKNDVV
jgi:hypothetical protein